MGWINRIAAIARHRTLESELDEELQLHIELKTQENIAAGMQQEEAHYATQWQHISARDLAGESGHYGRNETGRKCI